MESDRWHEGPCIEQGTFPLLWIISTSLQLRGTKATYGYHPSTKRIESAKIRHAKCVSKTHHTTLAVEVRVHLLLERRLVHVSRPNANAEGGRLLLGLPGDVLPDGDGRVDTTALLEQGADGAPRALRGDEDDIDISRGDDVGVLLVDDGETVGEVEGLALGDERGDGRPGGRLGGVGEEVHDDGTTIDGLLDGEEGLARHLRWIDMRIKNLDVRVDIPSRLPVPASSSRRPPEHRR